MELVNFVDAKSFVANSKMYILSIVEYYPKEIKNLVRKQYYIKQDSPLKLLCPSIILKWKLGEDYQDLFVTKMVTTRP